MKETIGAKEQQKSPSANPAKTINTLKQLQAAAKARLFFGRDREVAERYETLYGGAGEAGWAEKDAKRRQQLLALLIIAFLLAMVYAGYDKWHNDSSVITKDGRWVAIRRPAAEEPADTIDAKVYAVFEDEVLSSERQLNIDPVETDRANTPAAISAEDPGKAVIRKMEQALRSVTASEEAVILLPTQLEDGTPLVWKEERRPLFVLFMALFAMLFLYYYHTRYQRIEKLEQEARTSVIRELPVFLNHLMLLLGAGVVLDTAFKRALLATDEAGYFGSQMKAVGRLAEENRIPIVTAFRDFSIRSGVMELARLANILYDNVGHGNDLVEKLKSESAMLWFARKKQTEEQGRLAETKMTLPLAILLFVLLLITVTPALLEMG